MSKSEVESDGNIVTGTFLVNSKPAFVLFDSGASHSFLSKSFIEKHSLKPSSSCQAKVTTPSGETFLSKNLYLGMPIVISETELLVDLIEFNLKDFDLVLGMDWLRKYQDTSMKEDELGEIPVVKEFVDVFSDEIPEMPPVRELDFKIDLVPGT
ncbi:uncharacterized protein LOC130798888 [Amaranthus tricolor]|uniref:uncharacterized protein LOC130798888 n=1 Tax=Amaranthus tricolor TaxID=29722 RepID=UPI0025866B97|nr:uncharacterized protein LOC130798888 [Amaranthus tricolor]